ncbi:MAG: transposase, family [Pseudomonadota bacterium]|jgi:IS5 family transposase
MKQADLVLNLSTKRTRKRQCLDEMDRVVPWAALVDLIRPHAPTGNSGRSQFPIETMLRVHFLQQWFCLGDTAMEEALFDVPVCRGFAALGNRLLRLPDRSTILRFQRLLNKKKLAVQILPKVNDLLVERGLLLRQGTTVDATLIQAPSSTRNASGECDPAMHQTKKGNQWRFGVKAHIGADADSGLVHAVRCTAANAHDVVEANQLLLGPEEEVYGDAGYQGTDNSEDAVAGEKWGITMRPGERRALMQQVGFAKVRHRGLRKNTAQVVTLFAKLWNATRSLRGAARRKRPNFERSTARIAKMLYETTVFVSIWTHGSEIDHQLSGCGKLVGRKLVVQTFPR